MNAPYYCAPIPLVGVEITNRCNLQCRHCFNNSGSAPEHTLTLAELCHIFAQVKALGQTRIRLSGGEPTLHPDFGAVVIAAQRYGLEVSINSHGLFSLQKREELAAAPIALYIISLDGLREANDAIRGPGIYDRVVESATWLRVLGRTVELGVHLRRANIADIQGLAALAASLGATLKFSPLRPIGRAAETLREEILTPEDYYRAVQAIGHARAHFPKLTITTDFDILENAPRATPSPPSPSRTSCPAGRTMLNINDDGLVYPCAFLITPEREFAAGNIRVTPLVDIWQNSPVFLQFRTLAKESQCQVCFAYGQSCPGGCIAMAYALTGRLDGHDPTCFAHLIPPQNGWSHD